MAFEREINLLYDNSARLIRDTDSPEMYARTLTRFWPARVSDDIQQSGKAFLSTYCAVSNYPNARPWVNGLYVDGQYYPGIWRSVSVDFVSTDNVRPGVETQGFQQTLRRGFLTADDFAPSKATSTVLNAGYIVNEVHINTNDEAVSGVANSTSDDPAVAITVEIPNVDPAHTSAILTEFIGVGGEFASITVRGLAVTHAGGAWALISAQRVRPQDDGDPADKIRLVFARSQYTLNAYRAYTVLFNGGVRESIEHYLWRIPARVAQSIMDDFRATGRSARPSYREDGLVDLVLGEFSYTSFNWTDGDLSSASCSQVVAENFYFGVYDPSLYDITTDPLYQTSGVVIRKDTRLNREEGTWDVVIRYERSIVRRYPFATTRTNAFGNRTRREYLALNSDAELTNIASPPQGVMYSRDVRRNPDCTRDEVLDVDESTPISVDHVRTRTRFRTTSGTMYRSSRAPLDAPTLSGPGIYNVNQQLEADDTYSGEIMYTYSEGVGQAFFEASSTQFRRGSAILYKDWPAIISAPPVVGSGAYSVRQSLSDLGLYDGLLQYDIGTFSGIAEFNAATTRFRTTLAVLYRDWPDVISAPEVDGPGQYSVTQSLADDGLYNILLQYQIPTENGIYRYRAITSPGRHSEGIIYRDFPTPLAVPSDNARGLYRILANEINAIGLYDGAMLYEVPDYRIIGVVSDRSAVSVSTTQIFDNALTPVEPPTAWTGPGAYSVRQSMADDGVYSGTLQYRVGTGDGNHTFESLIGRFVHSRRVIYTENNAPIGPLSDVPVQGYQYSVSQTISGDGLYSGASEAEFGAPWSVSAQTGEATYAKVYRTTEGNQPDIPALPVNVVNHTYSRSWALNPVNGLYNSETSIEVTKPNAIYTAWTHDSGLTGWELVYQNWPSLPSGTGITDIGSAAQRRRSSARYNRDGSIDATFSGDDNRVVSTCSDDEPDPATQPSAFYYWHTVPKRVRATEAGPGGTPSITYGQEAMYHYVRYHASEAEAFEATQEGWTFGDAPRIARNSGWYKSDTILAVAPADTSLPSYFLKVSAVGTGFTTPNGESVVLS